MYFSVFAQALSVALILGLILSSVACEQQNRPPKNSAIIDIQISEKEAQEGTTQRVEAPDYEVYNLIIRPGIPDRTLLQLPPKIAERYPYPIYYRVNIVKAKTSDSAKPAN
jgi:hypothetical protein